MALFMEVYTLFGGIYFKLFNNKNLKKKKFGLQINGAVILLIPYIIQVNVHNLISGRRSAGSNSNATSKHVQPL